MLIVTAFAVIVRARVGGEFTARAIDDIGQAVAAAAGAIGCGWRARHSRRRERASWFLIAAACAAWGAGEVVWSYYELLVRRETPFPSFADLGYLMFPALALPGLLLRPSSVYSGRGRARVLLDGAMVAASLFNVSWATALGSVYREGGPVYAFTVSLAYPASDLIMLTVVVLVLAHGSVRAGLLPLVVGLAGMAFADSGFTYLTAIGRYKTGSVVDIVWVGAFLCLGLAGVLSTPNDRRAERDSGLGVLNEPHRAPGRAGSLILLSLPYACVVVGTVAEAAANRRGHAAPITVFIGALAVGALLVRELLTVLDNRKLVGDVMDQQAQLRFRAFHDTLTGLANRALFHDRVTHALALHARDHRAVGLLYCDLDGFKTVNDALGHAAGDLLLTEVARRLAAVTRPGDTVARLGGDEFAVLVEDGGDIDVLSERLLAVLAEPVDVGLRKVPVRASIGTATVGVSDAPLDNGELIKRADLAMYAAKRSGKGVSVAFTPTLRDGGGEDLDVMLALIDDVHAGGVSTAFQPILAVSGALWGHEALARWRYRGADLPPLRFIPLAERAGVLADLDLLMMRNALARPLAVPADGHRLLTSVNLGMTVLGRTDLVGRVADLLDRYPLERDKIVLEISESEALADDRASDSLRGLRELGIGLAVDDFGTGYSNLSRLVEVGPEIVKLDMSLIRPLAEPEAPTRLVSAVIELAHDLGAFVIGEGVETARQMQVLTDLGCDAVQGFLIGRPVLEAASVSEAALVPIMKVA